MYIACMLGFGYTTVAVTLPCGMYSDGGLGKIIKGVITRIQHTADISMPACCRLLQMVAWCLLTR
jgi:hypothetical protein